MELIAPGRDADVSALDDRRVLRRYRDGRSAHHDAELLSAVVAAGYPASAVLGVEGPGIVLAGLDGPTLADECAAGEAGALLASIPVVTDDELARRDDARVLAARPSRPSVGHGRMAACTSS